MVEDTFVPVATASKVGALPVESTLHAGLPDASVFHTMLTWPLPEATMPAEL
jgi:hypothetical protein